MDVTNLQVSIIAHLQWKSKLSDFFYGVENLTLADVPDHASCDFGKLLYSTVMEEFSDFSQMAVLERLHKEVHDDIKRLIQLPPEARKGSQGRQELDAFKSKCDRLVQIMENLEAQAKQR
ncbi:MAG: CZB domain-containing protein [Candidatus Electrothrix gigas]